MVLKESVACYGKPVNLRVKFSKRITLSTTLAPPCFTVFSVLAVCPLHIFSFGLIGPGTSLHTFAESPPWLSAESKRDFMRLTVLP